MHPKDLIGSQIDRVMRMDDKLRSFIQTGREYSEEELLLKSEKGQVRCIGSASAICGEKGSKLGAVFTFTKMKETLPPKGAASGSNLRFMFKDIIGAKPDNAGDPGKGKKGFQEPLHCPCAG